MHYSYICVSEKTVNFKLYIVNIYYIGTEYVYYRVLWKQLKSFELKL